MTDTLDLEDRLRSLGDDLALDESDELVVAVLARLDELPIVAARPTPVRAPRSTGWLRAAAIVLVVAAALLAIPSSRQAIADWFGLDGVDIERQPDLTVPEASPVLGETAPTGPGTLVEVEGTEILVGQIEVGEIAGVLDDALITKTLGAGTGIERVEVAGKPGLWIDGVPHVVAYVGEDGLSVSERFAGNTLLWQVGEVIHRVEGFETLDAALAFALEYP